MASLGYWLDGHKVTGLMERQDVSSEQLASKLHVKDGKVLAWVLGTHRCTKRTLGQMADIFGCDYDDLVVGEFLDQEMQNDAESDRRDEIRSRFYSAGYAE